MEFEWDEDKRLANIKNHGIDFVDVSEVLDGDIFTVEDDSRSGRRCQRYSYGEQRFVTFGLLKGSVVAVVNTDRGEFIRIISIRKATKNEYRSYFQAIAD
ncbi:MAG: BrnT family toxin [Alkalinema sp. RU_4_3]|nr:BrnT family toxin [Alkalinema sp. RU_4_3]